MSTLGQEICHVDRCTRPGCSQEAGCQGHAWREVAPTRYKERAERPAILADLDDAKVREIAERPTPEPQTGEWTLTAPDGRTRKADDPTGCVIAEVNDRVPPVVALARIRRALDEPPTEVLEWHSADQPPDAEITVLIAFDPAEEMVVEMGWHDEFGWHYCESGGDTPVAPKWWADMPEGPKA